MARPELFSHVSTWVFDLDNTLYPGSSDVFAQIHRRMAEYIAQFLGCDLEQAKAVRREMFLKHGTSLVGMTREHAMPPEPFLDYVHDIDLSGLTRTRGMRDALAALPGRRLVYTNGSTAHARNILAHLGLTDLFDDIFDIVASDYAPKPDPTAFDVFLGRHDVDPARAAFFEDMAVNLEPAHHRGMTTVLITTHKDTAPAPMEHVHHVTHDLPAFLTGLSPRR